MTRLPTGHPIPRAASQPVVGRWIAGTTLFAVGLAGLVGSTSSAVAGPLPTAVAESPYVAGNGPSLKVVVPKKRASVAATWTNDVDALVRVTITSNANEVQVKYRTRSNEQRIVVRPLRAGSATLVLPAGSKRITVRARATGELSRGRWTVARPARLHSWSYRDAAADIARQDIGTWIVEPTRTNGDFTGIAVNAKASRVTITLSFRELVPAAPRGDDDFNLLVGLAGKGKTGGEGVSVNLDSGSGSGRAGWDGLLSNGYSDYTCRGRDADFTVSRSEIVLSVPAPCLDSMRRFRVFASSSNTGEARFVDDALRTGMPGYRYARSPYIYR